jgi:hypothetical protein
LEQRLASGLAGFRLEGGARAPRLAENLRQIRQGWSELLLETAPLLVEPFKQRWMVAT